MDLIYDRAGYVCQSSSSGILQDLPFNFRETLEDSAAVVEQTDHAAAYPVLRPLLKKGLRVLEVGCGTGWFSNSLAYHHDAVVTGIDFNSIAVDRARAVARALNLSTKFAVDDLFRFEPDQKFELVVSLGVLHHTDNCAAAVRCVCEKFVQPGGQVLIGLYHTFGRKPLLDHFRALKEGGATEEQMLVRYRQLHSQIQDETLLRSWFRDQILHPNETQHTLEEMIPILEEAGMELISTSINRFQPFAALAELFTQEREHYNIAVERLKANRYFTGFFVFLARKREVQTMEGVPRFTDGRLIDSKPYIEHHPLFGYGYIPNTNLELPRPGGGRYHIQINSQSIRASREYSLKKPKDAFRIIVCGDSMAAGQFISNAQRFSELLERLVPKLEVINLGLEGSGTDQQILLYEHVGMKFEHDLVLLLPFLQNVRRNMVEAREGVDPRTGDKVLRPKPRFELVGGELVLRNVPVPKHVSAMVVPQTGSTDAGSSLLVQLKAHLTSIAGFGHVKKVVYAARPWEPFPEYRDPHSAEWQLMRALIHRLKALAGSRPVMVAPTFYASYVRFRMARNYWLRYSSLAGRPGIYPIDLLPYFRRGGSDAVRCFQEPHDMHFSAYGNLLLAHALRDEVSRLRQPPVLSAPA